MSDLPAPRYVSLFIRCFTTFALTGCISIHLEDTDAGDAGGRIEYPDAGSDAEPEGEGPDPTDGSGAACSTELATSGVDKVDLLLMIDNSGSMAEEQKKLADVLPDLVTVLTSGRYAPGQPTQQPDFPPVQSLHIGVISSDLGVNLAPPIESCGGAAYDPTAPDPANPNATVRMMAPNHVRLDKPFGDNAQLLTDTLVAQAGIWSRPFGTMFSTPVELVVPGDPGCAQVEVDRFIEFEAGGTDPKQTRLELSCIAKLGKNGCGLEQQLEAVYKALAPSSAVFSRNSRGQGTGSGAANSGFLREDAVLAVVMLTDEEDCSIPDDSSDLFNRSSSNFKPGDINTRCGKPENQQYLYPISRYVDGLRALKPEAFQNRIIFAAVAGIPLAVNLGNAKVHSGKSTLNTILNRQDMQFAARPASVSASEEEPVPVCIAPQGDGSATPARRLVETAASFGENGLATSICEAEYGSALQAVAEKIAAQLTGACLPSALPVTRGKVPCEIVEIRAAGDVQPCDAVRGRTKLPSRRVNGTTRSVCRVDQLRGDAPEELEAARGWYYDDASDAIMRDCPAAPQRIVFTPGAEPPPGAQVLLECADSGACP